MLLVHGMGVYSTGDPQTLITAIQTQMHLHPTRVTDSTTDTGAQVVRQDFRSDDGHQLRIYVLTWETLTEGLKKQYLAYDASSAATRPRLRIFNDVKQSLMNENVPDVVLYVGGYKPVLQKAVRTRSSGFSAIWATTRTTSISSSPSVSAARSSSTWWMKWITKPTRLTAMKSWTRPPRFSCWPINCPFLGWAT